MKSGRWWIWTAAVIAALMAALGVGNLIEDDGGPLYGRLIFAAVLIGAAVLVAAGIRKRSTDVVLGNRMIGLGVLPGSVGIAFFWFPPAAGVGILALVTSVAAFVDAKGAPSSVRTAGYGSVLLVLVLTVVAVSGG